MKKAALFAAILALALSASAQESHFPGPNVIGPHANGASASANGVSTYQAPNAQPVSATAKQASIAASPNAVQVGATASKTVGICLPILVVDSHAIGFTCK
jgi:hypothetical protein